MNKIYYYNIFYFIKRAFLIILRWVFLLLMAILFGVIKAIYLSSGYIIKINYSFSFLFAIFHLNSTSNLNIDYFFFLKIIFLVIKLLVYYILFIKKILIYKLSQWKKLRKAH